MLLILPPHWNVADREDQTVHQCGKYSVLIFSKHVGYTSLKHHAFLQMLLSGCLNVSAAGLVSAFLRMPTWVFCSFLPQDLLDWRLSFRPGCLCVLLLIHDLSGVSSCLSPSDCRDGIQQEYDPKHALASQRLFISLAGAKIPILRLHTDPSPPTQSYSNLTSISW